ncbi:MAG TPA: hypothetical protein VNF75_05730 [Candidatus Dormibacteraeota bacterium]|nr:hypothetical protein [Candidatus Dormibacteraeota bacterium]
MAVSVVVKSVVNNPGGGAVPWGRVRSTGFPGVRVAPHGGLAQTLAIATEFRQIVQHRDTSTPWGRLRGASI